MNEVVSKKNLVALESKIDKHFDDLTVLMSNFANQTNDKFNKIESKFDKRFDLLTNIIDIYTQY